MNEFELCFVSGKLDINKISFHTQARTHARTHTLTHQKIDI